MRRTRDALRDALLALMTERGWDAVDVQALCERADVGRSTFYQHFPNKETLLTESLAGLGQGLISMAPTDAEQVFAFLPGLLAHVDENRELVAALVGRRSALFVHERFRDMLVSLFERSACTPNSAPSNTPSNTPNSTARDWRAAARARAQAAALFELIAWWLGDNRPHTAADVEAVFRALWTRPA
ncbi:TetR/AcrR family transcriptional regulator [Roseateles paludis]|uniref:TetR/AcrR family transcriptional regulator n=1 Tax=Roseateles paludis TaxID=3145238 RepID=A0ABV0G2X5_9BURK